MQRLLLRRLYQLGVNPPADIASGRAHIVRWTMVLRRTKRSVDLQRCASCNCMTYFYCAPRSKNAEAFLKEDEKVPFPVTDVKM